MNVHLRSSILEELNQAIQTGTPEVRERALWYATDMLMVGRYADEEIWVFGEVIGRLAFEIEHAARVKLAQKLSRIDQAPGQVINDLAADDAIEVAGPVLRYSDRLDVRALVNHASARKQSHLLAISKRRVLAEPVTDVLVTRGDQDVARSVTCNDGARFSEAGFLRLIKRSANDSILAGQIGLRKDIPRHLFQQLIAKASDETRRKLERERPDMMSDVDELVADVTASLHSKFGPASPRYFAAKKAVAAKHRIGQLHEGSILEHALSHRLEETIVALTLLCSLPSDVVERALTQKDRDLLLIIARAINLSWDTTMALVFLEAPGHRISAHDLDALKARFERLHVSSSQEILSRYRRRRAAATAVMVRNLPEPPT
jgi:uncharacterized protein (DUF2336 family)